MFKIKEGFQFTQIALLDSGADVNCIKEGLVSSKYFEKSTNRVQIANRGELKVEYKILEVHICIEKMCIQTTFLLFKKSYSRHNTRKSFFNSYTTLYYR